MTFGQEEHQVGSTAGLASKEIMSSKGLNKLLDFFIEFRIQTLNLYETNSNPEKGPNFGPEECQKYGRFIRCTRDQVFLS